MKQRKFQVDSDGFYGVYYPLNHTGRAMIVMAGDSSDDHLARCVVRWFFQRGCACLAMSADVKDYGYHSFPLERFESAVRFLRSEGFQKIGIVGASTTGMIALAAASVIKDITMTIALSPSDFIMEGFIRDGKDGAAERPGDNESTLTWRGEPLPYLPFAYRHPEYWQKLSEEARLGGDLAASRKMFDLSERLHPLREEETIKTEQIHGTLICIGAEDDVLWDTCRYIRRIEERLRKQRKCTFYSLTYKHGTHFVFPESMMKRILPVGGGILLCMVFQAGRKHPLLCRKARIDIDRRVSQLLETW